MRLLRFAAAALFAAPGLASANELLNVYQLALDNDTQLQAARYARDASLEVRPQARSAILPTVSGAYSYTEGSSDGSSSTVNEVVDDVGEPVIDPATGRVQTLPLTRSYDTNDTDKSWNITLSQPVFDWAAFQTLRQSSDQLALAQASFRSAEQDVLLRASQTYFNVLAAADDLRFANAQKESVGRQLEQAQKRFEVGLSAITDVQEAQASYDLTIADVIAAEQALESAKQALVEVTNRQDTPLVPLQEEIPLPGPDPFDLNAWLDGARQGNLTLLSARLNAEVAQKSIAVARAGHLPTAALQGRYSDAHSSSTGSSPGDNSDSDNSGFAYGISVNVPIFSGGYVRSRVRQAESTYEQRRAEEEGSRRSVEHQTRDAYLGVLSGASRVRALKQAVVSNTTALEASETGFQVGTRTSVDVLNAQSLLYSARRDYARARYNYLQSILTLKAAAGQLNENDLASVDRLLIGASAP